MFIYIHSKLFCIGKGPDTHTRLWRVHCGCFKASLRSSIPSSPKRLSAKHKCISLLLSVRPKERMPQTSFVKPVFAKLKEKKDEKGTIQFPTILPCLMRKSPDPYNSHFSYRINLDRYLNCEFCCI